MNDLKHTHLFYLGDVFMLSIFQAETKDDMTSVRELFGEYLVWANSMLALISSSY